MNFRDSFRFGSDLIHLNNAGTAPLTWAARTKILELSTELAERGFHLIPELNQKILKARVTFADFLGTESSHIAFTANLATSISMVAWGLPFWEGDGILTVDQEYPSNAYVWHELAKQKNLRLEIFKSNPDNSINWDAFIEKIRPGVRAVVLSWVQYQSGVTAPLQQIYEACRRHKAWFVIDAIQGLGVMPFDFRTHGGDIVCSGSHKWTCGLTGHEFLAFKNELYLEMKPLIQGAMTFGTPDDAVDPSRLPLPKASRFEPGAPAHLTTLATTESLREIQKCGIENIHAHAMTLTKYLANGLHDLGLTVLGEPIDSKQAPIVTFKSDLHLQTIHEKLNQRMISHAYRNQTIRLSPHGFNTREEMDQVLKAVHSVFS